MFNFGVICWESNSVNPIVSSLTSDESPSVVNLQEFIKGIIAQTCKLQKYCSLESLPLCGPNIRHICREAIISISLPTKEAPYKIQF